MHKKVAIILGIISILVLVAGISAGNSIKNQLEGEVQITEPIYIDGSDITGISKAFVEIAPWFMGFVIVIYSVGIIAAIWIIYGIVMLVIHIVNRKKAKTKEV